MNKTEPKKTTTKKIKRTFTGTVVSDKMDKTIVVLVTRTKVHKKYKKRYIVTKKYKVHDEQNKYQRGDRVAFVECRPLSKDKRWRVVGLVNKANKKQTD